VSSEHYHKPISVVKRRQQHQQRQQRQQQQQQQQSTALTLNQGNKGEKKEEERGADKRELINNREREGGRERGTKKDPLGWPCNLTN
jgi:hypothetical protein